MKVTKVHINSKGIGINFYHQNSEDDKAMEISVSIPDVFPETVQKALNNLKDEACEIFGFDETKKKKMDVKGVSIKYKTDQTGIQISSYLKTKDSELGSSLVTPLKYDKDENVDFVLPDGAMKKVSAVRDSAIKFLKLKLDQVDLFSTVTQK